MFSQRDLYAPVNKVITGHASGKNSFSVVTSPNKDSNIGISGNRNNKDESVSASLNWDQKLEKFNLSGSLSQNGTISLSAKSSKLASGLKVASGITHKTDNSSQVKTNVEYVRDRVNMNTSLTFNTGKDIIVKLGGAGKVVDGLFVGGECELLGYSGSQNDKKLKDFSFGAKYSKDNFDIATIVENSLKTVRIGYAHAIDDQVLIAGQYKHDLKTEATSEKNVPEYSVGCVYVIDSDSSISAMGNTKGVVSGTYKLKINPRLSTAVSFDADAFNLSKGSSNIGFAVKYNA
jgi:hypothetical protein